VKVHGAIGAGGSESDNGFDRGDPAKCRVQAGSGGEVIEPNGFEEDPAGSLKIETGEAGRADGSLATGCRIRIGGKVSFEASAPEGKSFGRSLERQSVFLQKGESGERQGSDSGVLEAKLCAVHAGGKLGCESSHLEPFLFSPKRTEDTHR
jgi:hypothetical protein